MTRFWELKIADALLGLLTFEYTDQPLVFCRFEPQTIFTNYEALFQEELRYLNADAMDDWEHAYTKITALGLTLVPNDRTIGPITEFILHIDGERAWFRD